ncbi:MAG: translation elongation factor Ts [Calditrichaeota bacterium]|nr:translation elongation factor Ts [Calditrichota bacterium]RQW07782.1 MAG: translation elongation factor Ts [Calditrichota bacterium]
MEISAKLVKELREKTGAGMMDCKKALVEAGGDMEKAVEILRKRGIAKAEKKASREVKDGLIHAYIHPGGKLGVLVEVNCETDFVAKTENFQEFVHNIAMHIAASNPLAIDRESLAQDVIDREMRIFREQAVESGKPENIVEKIASGKMEKFYSETVLLEQPYIRDPEKTVKDYQTEIIARIGENISIRRFVRYQIGD